MFFEKLHEFFWENYNSSDYVYVGRKCLHRGEKILIKENNYECIKKYSPNEKKEIVKAFDTSITFEYVISVYAGGFIVLALSCIYPTRSILKMKARKMLI